MAEIDNSTRLAMMLASIGNAMQGRDIWSGISQGTNDFFAGMGALSKYEQEAADKKIMMDYHRAQGRRLDAQTEIEQEKARREAAAIEAYVAANGGGGMGVPGAAPSPGMGVPPSGPTMGPGNLTGSFYDRWAAGESAGNPQAVNPSGAAGRLQVMPRTYVAARTAIPGLPDDPRQTSVAQDKAISDWYTAQAMPVLARSLGRQPTPGELGLSTLAGPAGASALLRLDPNTPLASLPQDFWQRMGEKFTHQTFLAQNPQIAQLGTVGNVADFFRRRFEGGGAPSATPGQPPIQLAQAGGALPDVTSTTFGDARPTQPQQPVAPQQAQPQQPAAPQSPPEVPRPTMREIPPDINARINGMVGMRQISIDKAEALKNEYLDKLWQQRQQNARSDYEYKRGAGTTQQVSPDELKAAGFPEGTIAQRKRDGSIEVTHAPKGYTMVMLGDGQPAMVDTMRPHLPPIPVGPPKPPAAPTESQGKTAARLVRMAAAGPTVDAYEAFGTSGGERFLDNVPGGLGNYAQTPEYQKFRAAAEAWIVAHLRDDSGGAITKEEWAKYGPIYFPQPGDHAEVVAFKRQQRAAVEAGMKEQTAPSFKMPDRTPVPTPGSAPTVRGAQPVAAPKPPQIGAVENGYRFKGGDPAKPESWEKVQ